ncbi:MAG TPA: MFS transporter, partial [Bryobacteraceae bacterium]|nr:MFS transporter [Bryobacteraceae bacterium]
FTALLRTNRNYRYTWFGQVVSEVGDHFNNIAVFSLVMAATGSGIVITGVMLSRAVSFLFAGPLAGVVLDRMDRRKVMIASDLVRGVVALLFIATVNGAPVELLYVLSGSLMLASPFFSSGRSAILPALATPKELHTANALTQTTQWTTLAVGAVRAGVAVKQFGYEWAFVLNSLSFFVSAYCILKLRAAPHTFAPPELRGERPHPLADLREGMRYMRSVPLLIGIASIHAGWATGGGAAQILFGLFGDKVFGLGSVGIGTIWGFAGAGLVGGGIFAHWLGPRLSFEDYKRAVGICYVVHGGAYVVFSQMPHLAPALFFIALSRAAVAVSSVLNMTQLLTHVPDGFRGRVFATLETIVWAVMMLSMTAAGAVSDKVDPRTIGLWSGVLSSMTALPWLWASLTGRLPEPPRVEASAERAADRRPLG